MKIRLLATLPLIFGLLMVAVPAQAASAPTPGTFTYARGETPDEVAIAFSPTPGVDANAEYTFKVAVTGGKTQTLTSDSPATVVGNIKPGTKIRASVTGPNTNYTGPDYTQPQPLLGQVQKVATDTKTPTRVGLTWQANTKDANQQIAYLLRLTNGKNVFTATVPKTTTNYNFASVPAGTYKAYVTETSLVTNYRGYSKGTGEIRVAARPTSPTPSLAPPTPQPTITVTPKPPATQAPTPKPTSNKPGGRTNPTSTLQLLSTPTGIIGVSVVAIIVCLTLFIARRRRS